MSGTLQLPELDQIKITDSIWCHYTNKLEDVIIPYQWQILSERIPGADPAFTNWKILDAQADKFMQAGEQVMESFCIKNFRIAAGEIKGEHKGVIFSDSDLYKWLEAVAYCLHIGVCKNFEKIADEVISLIGSAQQRDGYLNTYYTIAEPQGRWSNLTEGHELYCAGFLIEAGIAYFEATKKNDLLNIAIRFADLICEVFGPGENQIKGYPGHQEIELALIKLFHCTGQRRYLDCARFFLDERGKEPNYFLQEIQNRDGQMIFPELREYELKYSQSHTTPRQQRTAEGHAVRATYMFCAMADIAREDHDEALLDTCRVLWKSITQQRMYITGGIGSSGFFERFTTDYDLPNDSSYCETCASIGLALFGRRMGLLERDATYFDVVERVLYNTVLAGISLSGDRYFYVNPLEIWPDNCLPATSMKHVKPERQRWFSVACCPTNVARTLASLGQYIYAQSQDTIYINLFISSSFTANVAGAHAELTMDSHLMQNGDISVRYKIDKDAECFLAVRVPDYANTPAFSLDGATIEPQIENGYAIICSNTAGEHKLDIQLHVTPRWVMADSRIREDVGKVALMKGPCVFCLEETDNGTDLATIYVQPEAEVHECETTKLPEGIPVLSYQGKRIIQNMDRGRLYGDACFGTEPVTLTAVPYGQWGNREPGEMLVWQKAAVKQ